MPRERGLRVHEAVKSEARGACVTGYEKGRHERQQRPARPADYFQTKSLESLHPTARIKPSLLPLEKSKGRPCCKSFQMRM